MIRRPPIVTRTDTLVPYTSLVRSKVAGSDVRGGSVSREGVQRDLLPLIEGTTVATKYGPMKTDHVLFIASGAFHVAKPSDLLPELQGRLPIRVVLAALSEADFVRTLTETKVGLPEQYAVFIGHEGGTRSLTPDPIERKRGVEGKSG